MKKVVARGRTKRRTRRLPENGDPPNVVRKKPFSWEELMKYTDPGPPEEAEEFVRLIHEMRRL